VTLGNVQRTLTLVDILFDILLSLARCQQHLYWYRRKRSALQLSIILLSANRSRLSCLTPSYQRPITSTIGLLATTMFTFGWNRVFNRKSAVGEEWENFVDIGVKNRDGERGKWVRFMTVIVACCHQSIWLYSYGEGLVIASLFRFSQWLLLLQLLGRPATSISG